MNLFVNSLMPGVKAYIVKYKHKENVINTTPAFMVQSRYVFTSLFRINRYI